MEVEVLAGGRSTGSGKVVIKSWIGCYIGTLEEKHLRWLGEHDDTVNHQLHPSVMAWVEIHNGLCDKPCCLRRGLTPGDSTRPP